MSEYLNTVYLLIRPINNITVYKLGICCEVYNGGFSVLFLTDDHKNFDIHGFSYDDEMYWLWKFDTQHIVILHDISLINLNYIQQHSGIKTQLQNAFKILHRSITNAESQFREYKIKKLIN